MLRRRLMKSTSESGGGNDANCITLLHIDNNVTNASSVSQTWTKGPYALYSSTIKKFGTYSIYDQYGVSASDPDPDGCISNTTGVFYSYLTGDWTIDLWFMTPNVNSAYSSGLCAIQTSSGGWPYFQVLAKSSGTNAGISIGHATTTSALDFNQTYAATITTNTWHHLAVVKKDGKLTIYLNGNSIASNISWTYTPNSSWTRNMVGNYNMGYIDEFRFSNIARWTSNFTPPTAPY